MEGVSGGQNGTYVIRSTINVYFLKIAQKMLKVNTPE